MLTIEEQIIVIREKLIVAINQRNKLKVRITGLETALAELKAIEKFEADDTYTNKLTAVFNEEE